MRYLRDTGHLTDDPRTAPHQDPPMCFQDAHSRMHVNLLKYFMAEGVAVGQKVAWVAARMPKGGPGRFLPAEAAAIATSSSANRQEEDGEEGDDESQAELRIAWQYRKYIQQQAAASSAAAPSGSTKIGSSGDGTPGAKAAAGPSKHGGAVEAGIGRAWCRSYDLTKSMGEEMPARSGMVSGVRCNS